MSTTITAAQAARQESVRFSGAPDRAQTTGLRAGPEVYNAMIDNRPALIARCADPPTSRRQSLCPRSRAPLAVRGGGTTAPGSATCDGGVVIDLSLLKDIQVDPGRAHRSRRGRLHVGRSRSRHRRARPGDPQRDHLHDGRRRAHARRRPRTSHREFGLTIDNLLEAELVLASGETVAPAPTSTPTCSGRSGAGAATSAS